MNRIILILFLVTLLSGCHSQKFDYGSSNIALEDDLEPILDKMMDKGNYNYNQKISYDRVFMSIYYRNGDVVLNSISFAVFRKTDEDTSHFDSTFCFDVEGELKCKEERGLVTGDRAEQELLLVDAFDIFSGIDVSAIVSEMRQTYQIGPTETIFLVTHLVLPSDIEDDKENFENRIFFYDDEYHYDENYISEEMMLKVVVYFIGNGEGEGYAVYFELE